MIVMLIVVHTFGGTFLLFEIERSPEEAEVLRNQFFSHFCLQSFHISAAGCVNYSCKMQEGDVHGQQNRDNGYHGGGDTRVKKYHGDRAH